MSPEEQAQATFDFFKERGMSLVIRTEIVPVTTQRELTYITLNDDIGGETLVSNIVVTVGQFTDTMDILKNDFRDDAWKNRKKPVTP